MSHKSDHSTAKPDLLVTTKEFFSETVNQALEERKVQATPYVTHYLVDLLEFYVSAENLHGKEANEEKEKDQMLAEQLLKAGLEKPKKKFKTLKKLADSSLYISGFFGDSLKRKIIDVDYYVNIGGSAYSNLATVPNLNQELTQVFYEFGERFLDYVDVLTLISQKSYIQTNDDLLRLYDRYVLTNSDLAKEQLAEKGILNSQSKKAIGQ